MPRLTAFDNVTLDGFFAGVDGDLRWAHREAPDSEFQAFVAENARSGGMLLFGRITYQLMASYWPTPLAMQNDATVAERINGLPKVVFSNSLAEATWANTTLVKTDLVAEVRRLKREADFDMTILGSGSIVSQLAQHGLIDEFQFVVNPVVLGQGRTLFDGVTNPLSLQLTRHRAFRNGNVLLCYAPTTQG
jgi:dihydrofolate reductase